MDEGSQRDTAEDASDRGGGRRRSLARAWSSDPGLRRAAIRTALAGPVALAVAVVVMAAMPLWFPEGAAGIDHLVLPLVLFPAIWAVAFFYACLTEKLGRASVVLMGVLVINAAAAGWAIWISG